jgi:AraC-like DNA-binding protein
MTLKEVCKALGKSESTLKNAFKRTQENLAKKGIILTKEGIGRDANYTISYVEDIKEGE